MIAAADPLFVYGNIGEGGLWAAIGCAFSVRALRDTGSVRTRCTLAAVTFLLFGVSDFVEVLTGAWWRPWWLLAWKAACVAVLAGLLIDHHRRKRKG